MSENNYEFAIKTTRLNSGKEVHTPVCRERSKLSKFVSAPWYRIVKIYDTYLLMDLNFEPDLTYLECEQHIERYKNQLNRQNADKVLKIEFLLV